MLNYDIEGMPKEDAEKMIEAIDVLLSHMPADKLVVTVDQILNEELPDDVLDALKTLNLGLAANGYLFDNDKQGFLAYLMEDMYGKRKTMKGHMIQAEKNVEEIKHLLKERGIEV